MASKFRSQQLECLTLGDIVVKDSRKNQKQRICDSGVSALNFFGIKSDSDRPQVKTKRNFRHEAEMLMVEHFNGVDQNFGFKKTVGVAN